MKPALLVIAGPNGSGKTTVTIRLKTERWSDGVEYLNADDIAEQRFGGWNSPQAIIDAANWVDERREALLGAAQGIAFETVFSSPAKIDFLQRAKGRGYFLRFFFIGTSDPRINAARVANRVIAGGHTVPIDKIVQRYTRSMANLAGAIQLCDRVYIYDNSIDDVEARLCARIQDGLLRKVYDHLPTWVDDAVSALAHHSDFVDMRAA
jgi:predicted ABC-type ATPase